MSFLYYDNNEPITKASFKAVKAKELSVWDEESGQYLPVVGGSGGSAGELPYYLKTNSVEIGPPTQKTIIANDGVDVIDNTSNKSSELTAEALTLGTTSGNSILDKASIDTCNKLKNIASTASTAGQSMVTFNPGDSTFKYAPILSNPSWILPTSAEFNSGSFKTSLNASSLKLDESAVTKFLLFRNTVEPNNEIQLRWNDTLGNQISSVGAYSVLNKKLLIPGSNGVVADNTGVFCGDVGSTGNPNLSSTYVKTNNLGISLSNGPTSAAIGTTGISFTSGGVTNVITNASVVSMNKLRTISSLPTPTSEYRAVLHDPATGNYRYTPIVTPATLPVTRRIAVPDAATRYFTKVTDDFATAAGSNTPVVKLLNDGDTLLIDSVGLTSSNGLEYDTWLAIQVSSGSDAVVDCRVEMCTNTNYHAPNAGKAVVSEKYNAPYIIWHRTDTALTYSGGTIPARTLIFKLGNTNTTYGTGQVFQGVISIKMLANSRTTVPT